MREEKLPNAKVLNQWLPRELTSFLFIMVLGSFVTFHPVGLNPSPGTVDTMFVVLLLPGVVVSHLEHFGREGVDWTNVRMERGVGRVGAAHRGESRHRPSLPLQIALNDSAPTQVERKVRIPALVRETGNHVPTSWSGRPGSNRRPRPWQGRALPTELRPRGVPIVADARCATKRSLRRGRLDVRHRFFEKVVPER